MSQSTVEEQLVRWADHVAATTPPTRAEDISRAASTDSRPVVTRARWITVAAAAVAVAVLAAGWLRDTRAPSTDVHVDNPPLTTDSSARERRPTHSDNLNAEWIEVSNPGPLSPRQGAAVALAGGEVIVLGGERHHDGAAFNPETHLWRPLPEPPLPDGVPQTTWTGNELLAVTDPDSAGGIRHAAAYNPVSDTWRKVAAPPPAILPNLGGTQTPTFLWAGTEAILADAWAAYDPVDDKWTALPHPTDDDLTPLAGGPAVVVAVGRRVVVAEPGVDTWMLDLDSREWTALPATPRPTNIVSEPVAAVVVEGVIHLTTQGHIYRLRPTGWELLHQAPAGGNCIPRGHIVGSRPVFDHCGAFVVQQREDSWRAITAPTTCCYLDAVSTGAFIVVWDSNDDTANDPSAPRKSLYIWTPDPTED